MKLQLQINSRKINDPSAGKAIMITPPIGEDYWILRVNLYEDQSIIAFPKFITIGIGFAKEEDWNTNLPYTCSAEEICNHIYHNRRYVAITKKRIIRGIKMIQDYINEKMKKD